MNIRLKPRKKEDFIFNQIERRSSAQSFSAERFDHLKKQPAVCYLRLSKCQKLLIAFFYCLDWRVERKGRVIVRQLTRNPS
ncbi:MAG: hypothetical protein D3924_08040 [Candidatus Electrothrix sp. AR4]|nr:hypothetical protein [Candidatus Electrothrix sp. AR4]